MLNNKQKAILKAYGKARMTLMSHGVVFYDHGNDDTGYLVQSCEELGNAPMFLTGKFVITNWMHANIHPDFYVDYGIDDDDFYTFMTKRFPLLYRAKEH